MGRPTGGATADTSRLENKNVYQLLQETISATQYDYICLSMFIDFMNEFAVMDEMWPKTTGEYVIVFMDYTL